MSVVMLLNDIKIKKFKKKTISLGSSQIEVGHQVFYRRNPEPYDHKVSASALSHR